MDYHKQEILTCRIHSSYRPYNRMIEYWEGFVAYGQWDVPHPYCDPHQGVQAQAYDRGMNAAMRIAAMQRGVLRLV